MPLSADSLEQAHHLATREKQKPKQASLRRTVSAAYYALFHLLCGEGSRLMMFGVGVNHADYNFGRSFPRGQVLETARKQ